MSDRPEGRRLLRAGWMGAALLTAVLVRPALSQPLQPLPGDSSRVASSGRPALERAAAVVPGQLVVSPVVAGAVLVRPVVGYVWAHQLIERTRDLIALGALIGVGQQQIELEPLLSGREGLGVRVAVGDSGAGRLRFGVAGSVGTQWRHGGRIELRQSLPGGDGSRFIRADAGLSLWPDEHYWGTGPNTARADDAAFSEARQTLHLGVAAGPRRLRFGGDLRAVWSRVSPSADDEPAVTARFPGLLDSNGVASRGWIEAVLSVQPAEINLAHPLRGGWGRFEFGVGRGLTPPFTGRYVVWSGQLTRGIEIYKGRGLIGRVVVDNVAPLPEPDRPSDSGRPVPFVRLPSLGGPERLRGYERGRFRDAHAVLLLAEYRFPVWNRLAGGLFYEVGQVSQRFADLARGPRHSSYGLGLRIASNTRQTVTRLDLAASPEGFRLNLVLNGPF